MPTFTPPTQAVVPLTYRDPRGRDLYRPVPRISQKLFRYFRAHSQGMSVLKIAGVWQTIAHPTADQIDSCDLVTDTNGQKVRGFFQGGHAHPITSTVSTELTAAGYGSYIV